MSHFAPILPENAPFSGAAARLAQWLARGLFPAERTPASRRLPRLRSAAAAPADENFPWHDMTLPLDERHAARGGQAACRSA